VRPTNADRAEGAAALEIAGDLSEILGTVEVLAEDLREWMPERLSFLLARDNFEQCVQAFHARKDIAAGNLARALFEEAIRWSWVDEEQDTRRSAFLQAAAHRHRQIDEAGRRLGIDPNRYYGPLVDDVLQASEGATKFPRQIEGQLEWGLGSLSEMLYTQYRLFSQYTHSSLLASASVAETRGRTLQIGRLPQVARMTVLRNAVANMAVIVDGCKLGLGLSAVAGAPLNVVAMSHAVAVAEALQEFAPATD
jgi:hypothetical protein